MTTERYQQLLEKDNERLATISALKSEVRTLTGGDYSAKQREIKELQEQLAEARRETEVHKEKMRRLLRSESNESLSLVGSASSPTVMRKSSLASVNVNLTAASPTTLRKQVSALQQRLALAETNNMSTSTENNSTEVVKLQQENEELKKQMAQVSTQLEECQSKLSEATQWEQKQQEELAELEDAVQHTKRSAEDATRALEETRQQLSYAETALMEKMDKIEEYKERLTAVQTAMVTELDRLQQCLATADNERHSLQQKLSQSTLNEARNQTLLEELQRNNESLHLELRASQDENAQFKEREQHLLDNIELLRTQLAELDSDSAKELMREELTQEIEESLASKYVCHLLV